MREVLLLVVIACAFLNCKAQETNVETAVLISLNNEILKRTALKRVKEHGIVFKECNDYNWHISFFNKNPFVEDGVLSKVKDSLTHVFFSKENRENYNKQLKRNDFSFDKLDFKSEKIAIYSDKIEEKHKTYKFVKFNSSKPVFSIDGKKAIVFSSSSHEPKIYLFEKKLNLDSGLLEWKIYKTFNSLFSNLNY
ncbi:hypothetical protein [Lacinutrix sp.]|uniref:hypothetical protein n=1 Tax=Lacinutrix sp. TaxID=1937692 RepID=UPI0025BDBEE5|nr:hypothetical protein [Lacinutrix sp.]